MDQGWQRLPLLVVFLLFWRNADGFEGGSFPSAYQWGHSTDSFSPRAVQSSVSEAQVTGTLPVEVGSSLSSDKPLESKSRLNILQFVKGGPSISQSASHAQTAPSSSVSDSLPLPVDAQPSSLTSSGSTLQGAANGLSLLTQYAASGSGPVVSTQGEGSSYPAKLVVSGQSTGDRLPVSSAQDTSVHQSAEASLPVLSQSISYSSSSAPGALSISQSSPVLLESSGQHVSSQGDGSHSVLSQGASSPYTSDSNTKLSSSAISSQSTGDQSSPSLSSSSQGSSGRLLASGSSLAGLSPLNLSSKSPETSSQLLPLPLVGSIQSTSGQSSPNLLMVSSQSSSASKSTDAATNLDTQDSVLSGQAQGSDTSQGSSGVELSASSVQSVPIQVGSYSVSQSLSASSLHTPGSLVSNKLDSLPLGVSSQSISAQSSASVSPSTQSRSGTQLATSSRYVPVKGGSSSSLYRKPPGTLGQYAPASPTKYVNAPVSSPQSTSSQSASVLSSRNQYTSASQGSSGAPFGASTGFPSLGMSSSYSGPVQSQASGLICKCALSPQGVDSQSITDQSSHKQFTSTFGTQSGSSTPFTLQGSITYDGSPQPQGTASQFAPVSQLYQSILSPSQDVASRSILVSRKQLASTYTGSSGTQAGSSLPFSLQGSTAYGGSPPPQNTAGQFAPGSQSSYESVSLSSPQAVNDPTTVQSSRKQFTSTFTGSSGTQAGSSPPFTLQGSTAYGRLPQPQDATSLFAAGSSSPYASVSLSSPQGVDRQSSSQKRFTSSSQGSSGAVFGASTGLLSQRMSRFYSGSVQSKGTTIQTALGSSTPYASVSLSSPQAGPSTTALGSLKQLTSTYTSSSGTQAGSSPPFTLQGSTAYGGSPQPKNTVPFAPGSQSSYASVLLSSPQAVAGPGTVQSSRKQFTSTFTGSSGTQAGSSTRFTLQGSTAYDGSSQPQDAAATQGISSSAGGSPSRYSGQFVSAQGGSTSYGGSLQSQSLSTKYIPGSQLLSSYSSIKNQNAPAQTSRSSSSSHFYSVKG